MKTRKKSVDSKILTHQERVLALRQMVIAILIGEECPDPLIAEVMKCNRSTIFRARQKINK